MERIIIEFKNDVSQSKKEELKNMIESSFNNRVGTISNCSGEDNKMIFESKTEDEYLCLLFGNVQLRKRYKELLDYLSSWNTFYDDNPEENTNHIQDVLENRYLFER